MRIGWISVFVIVALLSASNGYSQWRILTPSLLQYSSEIPNFITYSDGVLWAGAYGKMYKSLDRGRTWSPISYFTAYAAEFEAQGDGFVYADFIDRNNGVVSTIWHGMYVTTDGGTTWTQRYFSVQQTYNNRPCFRVKILGSIDTIVGLAINGQFHKSTDRGNTWRDYYLSGDGGQDFAVDGDGVISAFIIGPLPNQQDGVGWLTRSTDNGETWTARSGQTEADSWSLSADRCNHQRLLLSNENIVHGYNGMCQIFRSDDAGNSWSSVLQLPEHSISGSLFSTSSATYAGGYAQDATTRALYRTTDAGNTWKSYVGPNQVPDSHAITAIDDNTLFALDRAGNVWVTYNAGGDSVVSSTGGGSFFGLPLIVHASDCDDGVLFELFRYTGRCGSRATLDSITIRGSTEFNVDPLVLPRVIDGVDSIGIRWNGPNQKDSATLTLHFSVDGIRHDTSIGLAAIRTGDVPMTLEVIGPDGSGDITLSPGAASDAVLRFKTAVSSSKNLKSLQCTLTMPRDALSRAGNCMPTNGWQVSEFATGTSVGLTFTRLSVRDIAAGEELARVPFAAKLAIDRSAPITLTMSSTNTDYLGCLPSSTEPDSLVVHISTGCGDSLIRKYMQTNEPLILQSLLPNPASSELLVQLRTTSAGWISYSIIDALGNRRKSGSIPPETLSVADLAPGVYALQLTQNGFTETVRFVISR
jgi:photosystem II stability/assembly factor-like uncharacterized protein